MSNLHLLVLLALAVATFSGRAHAYELEVRACNATWAGTPDEGENTVTFRFCEGGTYCDADYFEVPLPAGSLIEVPSATITIPVDSGFVPTTVVFEKSATSDDSWCIDSVVWEGGDNLLGDYAFLALEGQTGEYGCIDGAFDTSGTAGLVACKRTWRFFNLNGADDYLYDVKVQACAGTTSSSVMAYFCSNAACDLVYGEEEEVELVMDGEDGGWTTTSFPLSFNPLAVRLEEVDDTWCAEAFTFNSFQVSSGTLDTSDFAAEGGSILFQNIQEHGSLTMSDPTPAPSPGNDDTTSGESEEEESAWLDAAWEVAVTVVGTMVVAAGAACGSFMWRRNRADRQKNEAGNKWCVRPVTRDGPLTVTGENAPDVGVGKEQEEQPPFL